MNRSHHREVVAVARRGGGLIHARDLAAITGRPDEGRRRLRSELWQQVLPGVLAPAPTAITSDLVAAASMLWAPESMLSHHLAAARSGIWVPEADRVRITVPFESPRRSNKRVEVIRSRHFPPYAMQEGVFRWTPPARTIVDLGMVLTRKQLEAVLLCAIRRALTTAAAVDAVAAELAGRAGLADVRAVTALWAPERESLLEDRLYTGVESQVSCLVVRQHRVLDRPGRIVARIDVALPELRLAFEADGLHFHSTDEQIGADQARDRLLARLGWLVVRFREDALADPIAVRREIRALVERRRRDLAA